MVPLPPQTDGRAIAIFGDTGAGKTTLSGDYSKAKFKAQKKRTRYNSADLGGHKSIDPLIKVGVIEPKEFVLGEDDPWVWANEVVSGDDLADDIGLVVFDSGTNLGESIMAAIRQDPRQIGQQKTQRFSPRTGLSIGLNNEAHYGLVQGFLLDMIWKSTWLTRRGIDLIWTFGVDRKDKADQTPVLGPMLVGHALTHLMPKWFHYTFRAVSIPVAGQPSIHRLYIQEQPEMGVGMSFGNARYPLDATSVLPAYIEPASLSVAFELIERGQDEAEAALRAELGL